MELLRNMLYITVEAIKKFIFFVNRGITNALQV